MENQNSSIPGDHSYNQATYQSYLLRVWKMEQTEQSNWRASLEDSRTGERFGFANLEQLFAFLLERIERTGHNANER